MRISDIAWREYDLRTRPDLDIVDYDEQDRRAYQEEIIENIKREY